MLTGSVLSALVAVALAVNSTSSFTRFSNSTSTVSTAGNRTTSFVEPTIASGVGSSNSTAEHGGNTTTATSNRNERVKPTSTRIPLGLELMINATNAEMEEEKKPEGPRVEVAMWLNDGTDYSETESLLAGRCYDLAILAGGVMHRNLEKLSIYGGRCMIWEKPDCEGKAHTNRLHGYQVMLDEVCKNKKWAKSAVSIRCCKGGPGEQFCDVKDDKNAVCKK